MLFRALVFLAMLVGGTALQKPIELNSLMMDATFKIVGPADLSNLALVTTGTGFLIGRPVPNDTQRAYFVLVTAAHVLNGIQGDTAILVLRVRANDGKYARYEHKVRIRQAATKLWVQHPSADVAVLYVNLPDSVSAQPLPDEFLATDADFDRYKFHPGDEVYTVGYPYGLEANTLGFPILRSGRIASYPLSPASELKTFKVDFSVFGGNSGGAIFINQLGRQYGTAYHLDERVFRVLGLVSNQVTMAATGERLNVAGIVYAQFIRETVALLSAHPKR